MTTGQPRFIDVYRDARLLPAFANDHDRQAWQTAWCATCTFRSECALIKVATAGRTPQAWVPLDHASLVNRYLCRGWTPLAGTVFGDHERL